MLVLSKYFDSLLDLPATNVFHAWNGDPEQYFLMEFDFDLYVTR